MGKDFVQIGLSVYMNLEKVIWHRL